MSQCSYSNEYLDDSRTVQYRCSRAAQTGKNFCLFHDRRFLKNAENRSIAEKEFHEQIRHGNTEFIGYYLPSLTFKPGTYSKPMNFSDATFVDKLDFSGTTFTGNISFTKSRFKRGAIFRSATFTKKIDFTNAICHKYVDFQFCKFQSDANFTVRVFENANFKNAEFSKANFTSAVFKGQETSFWKAIFNDRIYFTRSSFHSPTNFSDCRFLNKVKFSDAIFKEITRFENVVFANPKLCVFDGNISQVSFLETKIDQIKFGNRISWKNIHSKNAWYSNLKSYIYDKIGHNNFNFRIFDERELEKEKVSSILLESVRDIYRQLIENFDQQMRYDISGEFFIREMEIRRKYHSIQRGNQAFTSKKNNLFKHFSILWVYNIFAQYGQSYRRPIYLILPIICISTLHFWYGDGSKFSNTEFLDYPWTSLVDAFFRSLTGFFPFYNFNSATTLTHVDFMLRLTLLPIAGTLFVALKRQLERKFRH